jgi:hypothetical protein
MLKCTKALNSTIHLVLDGWTAPIVASFLGIVVVWVSEGTIYRAVLEFIRSVLDIYLKIMCVS